MVGNGADTDDGWLEVQRSDYLTKGGSRGPGARARVKAPEMCGARPKGGAVIMAIHVSVPIVHNRRGLHQDAEDGATGAIEQCAAVCLDRVESGRPPLEAFTAVPLFAITRG